MPCRNTSFFLFALAFFTQSQTVLAALTYSQDVKPILDSNCIECHSSGNDPDLSQFPFQSDKLVTEEVIVSHMLANIQPNAQLKMPPGNRASLASSDIATIQAWHDQGMNP